MSNNFEDKERILIVGLPKSGTTILTYRVAGAFHKTKIFFEPGKEDGLNNKEIHQEIFNHPRKNILSKCLFVPTSEYDIPSISPFYNKKIWIYRDPRDWIISAYFYRWRQFNPENYERILSSIQKKENNPTKVPFHRLLPKKFPDKVRFNHKKLLEAMETLDDSWLLLKYEDFVDNKIDSLNSYLNVQIDTDIEVDKQYERVTRSKAHSNWRQWFNQEDVAFFSELLNPYLEALNYDINDWGLEIPEQLDSTIGSEYLKKLIALKTKN